MMTMSARKSGAAALLILMAALSTAGSVQDDQRIEIVNIRYHTHQNFTRIVLDIGELREYSSGDLRAPDRIYVDVLQARLNPLLHNQGYPVKTDYLSQIRIAQKSPSTVRMTADIDFSRVESYRVYHIFDPFRLVIDITPRRGQPSAVTTPPDPLATGYSMARQLGLGVRTVIIDPGHGGRDPGAIGKSGLKEKDVALEIAQELKNLLSRNKDLQVILTRESDVYIRVEDRPVIANQKAGDIFVSIHVNASRNEKREGIETFYLNISPDPAVNELAARENATSTKNIGQMRGIIQQIVQNSKIYESRGLAERIQKHLVQTLAKSYNPVRDLGTKGGPFWVLIGGDMPSVLVEVSHLSHPREEARLKTPQYRQAIARGIHAGILDYIQSLGKEKTL
jgi:N-acetylmuramoyl-L-alanine amidase